MSRYIPCNMTDENAPAPGTPQDGVHFNLSHIRKKDLTPPELNAVLKHLEEMEKSEQRKILFEEALADWMKSISKAWERSKFNEDMEAQRKEIEKHRWIESEKAGKDIGASKAAEDWIANYAPIWRKERESLERNGWEYVHVIVGLEKGLHMQPSSTLANIASGFKCQVYVHRDGMEVYNFLLNGEKYTNVKSLMGLLTLGATCGDKLVFIASGPQARKALEAIAEFVSTNKKELVTLRSWERVGGPGDPNPEGKKA